MWRKSKMMGVAARTISRAFLYRRGMGMQPGSYRVQPSNFDSLKSRLSESGFNIESRPRQSFLARRPGLSVAAYPSGKVVVGGYEPIGLDLAGAALTGFIEEAVIQRESARPSPPISGPRIGLAVAGRSRSSSLVVVVGVLATEAEIERLKAEGLGTSDLETVTSVYRAQGIVRRCVGRSHIQFVTITRTRFDELVSKMGGEKGVIGWAQRNCVRRLLRESPPCDAVLGPELVDPSLLRDNVSHGWDGLRVFSGRAVTDDMSVIAAWIIAQALISSRMRRVRTKRKGPFIGGPRDE